MIAGLVAARWLPPVPDPWRGFWRLTYAGKDVGASQYAPVVKDEFFLSTPLLAMLKEKSSSLQESFLYEPKRG